MKKLLIVTSSVRDGRNADKILELTQKELKKYPDFQVTVADFKTMPLPFIDTKEHPSAEDFAPTNKNVITWTEMVRNADAVLMLVAEYNHSYTPVLKNAIDWVFHSWIQKPVALIGYGWAGGSRATKHLRDVLASNIDTRTIEAEANLRFMKEIDTEGNTLNNDAAVAIDEVLESLQQTLAHPETAVEA